MDPQQEGDKKAKLEPENIIDFEELDMAYKSYLESGGTFPSHKAFAGGFAVGLITSWLTIALCEAGLPADLKYNLRYYSFPIAMAINIRLGQKV